MVPVRLAVTPAAAPTVRAAVTRLAREDSGRVLAVLAAQFGDVDLVDDCVQDALADALTSWRDDGVPENPAGWLTVVARRRAIDRLRRREVARRRLARAAPELLPHDDDGEDAVPLQRDDAHVDDEHLRLLLLCCHPALATDAQLALTLRLVGGLTTGEIAAAFLVPEPTLAQRLVRAKRKIRDARIPLSIPTALDGRVEALTGVLYLIFNEGYLARGDGADPVRVELVDEAVRLTELSLRLLPDHPELLGLLALQLFHRSRLATRVDGAGELVLLADQDRTQWDLAAIDRANGLLARAMAQQKPGPRQLEAAIAGYHANARTAADTDWPMIAALYAQLAAITGSAVVGLNHAVAVSVADGPRAGLALLDRVVGLDQYHLFHAARAEMLLAAGRRDDAAVSFDRAAALAVNPAEQRHLARRRRRCD